MDLAGSYTSLNLGSPLLYLCGSTLCYIVTGVTLLVAGVIITSVSFQNLESYHHGGKERYAGPVLIGAGLLVMGKGAVSRLKESECRGSLHNLWRKLRRRRAVSSKAGLSLLSVDPPPMYIFVLGSSSREILRPGGGRMQDVAAFTQPGRAGRWALAGSNSKHFMDRILKSTLCHLILGASLLLAGVLVTASTLHGNDDNVHGNLFVVGPILIVAGMFGISRVMFKRASTQQRRRRGRRRLREEQGSPGAGSEPGTPHSERPSNDTAIYLEPTDFGEDCYEDSPPPYEVVTSDRSSLVSGGQSPLSAYAHCGAMDNPALQVGVDATVAPPPSYEEVIHMQQRGRGAGLLPDSPPPVALVLDEDSGCSIGSHISVAPDGEPAPRQPEPPPPPGLAHIDIIHQTEV